MTSLDRIDIAPTPLPVQDAYDLSAPFYDSWSWQQFWRTHEYPVVRDVLDRVKRGRGRAPDVLDVGCGTGWYLRHLQDLCGERVGIDLSGGMLAIAEHRLPGVFLEQADARKLPFADRRFDAVLCTRVLSHLSRIESGISEMRRVLIAGGMLILSDVDAVHDYQYTKLPLASGHIFADTFKHDRSVVFKAVEEAGFVFDAASLIYPDGRREPIRRRGVSKSPATNIGWIGTWRRSIT